MVIWFASMAVVIVWTVFRSPAVDYRMVALGAVIPSLEGWVLAGPLHTLALPTAVLVVVMFATMRRRIARRRYLGIPIGMYLHLVVGGAWSNDEIFWWPVTGTAFDSDAVPMIDRGLISIVLELVGVGVAAWLFNRFGLDDAGRRRMFLRTGQLDRAYLAASEPGGPS